MSTVACDSMKIQCTGVSVPPSSMRSKFRSSRGSVPTCSPFTNVPFRLPRSAIQNPSESPLIPACCRDTPRSSTTMSLRGARPMTTIVPDRGIELPLSEPPWTSSIASPTIAIVRAFHWDPSTIRGLQRSRLRCRPTPLTRCAATSRRNRRWQTGIFRHHTYPAIWCQPGDHT